MSPSSKKIGIAGAGIIGRLTAFLLLEAGHTVSLFDQTARESTYSCSHAAAGMLSPYAELETAERSIFELGYDAAQQWSNILARLTPPSTSVLSSGSLLLAHPQDQAELTRLQQLFHYKLSVTNSPSPQEGNGTLLNTAHALQALEPELSSQFTTALHIHNEAHIDPCAVLSALERTLIGFPNFSWHEQHFITKITPGTLYTERPVPKKWLFDDVIDCRGLGARDDLKDLRGVRGELVRVYAPQVSIKHIIRLIHPRYPLYIAPKLNHEFIIGASVIETEDTSPISLQTLMELLSAAYSLHPGFAEARLLSTKAQCRPAFPDNQPRLLRKSGLITINGLYRHGYLLAPAFAHKIKTLL